MGDLIKYEPQTVLQMSDGEMYFTQTPLVAMKRILQANKMVEVNEQIIRSRDVKKVYEDKFGVASMNRQQRQRLEQRKKEFRYNLGREPSEQAVKNMIARILGSQK